ncbi:MAG TPA: L-aspartate oxidase [Clostridiales bacterium]|nr:L-aspartate oxidase [Clostridiales bacterium]
MNDYRFLVDFDTKNIEMDYYDVIIIGSGIAGVYTALEIPEKNNILILTKETLEISNSVLAQGGIAVSLDKGDSPELHLKDTLYAGAGLCNEESVWVLVSEAALNIEKICEYGVKFDRKSPEELAFGREAAHSKSRIIHAGDTTGKEVLDKLISVVKTKPNVKIKERSFAIDLLTENNETKGVIVYDEDTSKLKIYLSHVVVCATGGYGQLYENTTNPEVATGDGTCLAYRAGAELMDLEFIQFHPTVLFHPENKSFLISEAVRGEGAILKNINKERFMPAYHEMAELAPRDVVSRAIFQEMKKTGSDHVYLDITFKGKEYLENRFPNIYKTCLNYGIDISKDYIPVAPAEHYCMGGIKTNIHGRTNIKGFYACGEAACNGIHGANRLASNSLLEGLVFGHKIGIEITDYIDEKEGKLPEYQVKYSTDRIKKDINIDTYKDINKAIDKKTVKNDIKSIMTQYVGIIRNKEGLEIAKDKINRYRDLTANMRNTFIIDWEIQNMVLLSSMIINSALQREESRGAHYRSDFSHTDDENWKRNIIVKKQTR